MAEMIMEIDDVGEVLESYKKTSYLRFPFPAITIGERYAYFNKYAASIMPEKVKWATTSQYVLVIPSTESTAYKTLKRSIGYQVGIPPELIKGKKLKLGNYRLYKYKDGFAFKRYEQIT